MLSLLVASLAIASSALISCEEETTSLLLEVRTRSPINNLLVKVKQYHDDDSVTIYQDVERTIGEQQDYLVSVGGAPLRLDIQLPSEGRYAVHLVGSPIDNPTHKLIATFCDEVQGVELHSGIVLNRLTPELDVDGDTFPESVEDFCITVVETQGHCDATCNGVEWLAMEDCNPGEDYEVFDYCPQEIDPDERWNPFVIEPCGDCHDQDCWRGDVQCQDRDGDNSPENLDCNDDDPSIHPGAEEICGNGIDENCNSEIAACSSGDLPCDDDGDGYRLAVPGFPGCGDDCDDTNDQINPGIPEGYGSDPDDPLSPLNCDDLIDNNCDGQINERCINDFDGDGSNRHEDCNDCNAAVGPGFREECNNRVDEDCDSIDLSCESNDRDRDGIQGQPGGSDCDDSNPLTYPGAPDRCDDGIASNCSVDLSCDSITDSDGDGFDDTHDDCNSENASMHPWAEELCNNSGSFLDDDCDGIINEIPAEDNFLVGCGFDPQANSWLEINYQNDAEHCGSCHHACALGNWYREGDYCADFECICEGNDGLPCAGPASSYCCSDGCRDISSDPANCGACGHECVRYSQCDNRDGGLLGACHCFYADGAACDLALHNACCPDVGCTNLNTDPHNCGDCGIDCLAPEGAGPMNDQPRGDRCDPGRSGCACGDSFEVCLGTTWCTEVTELPTGRPACGCADLTSDPGHCGRCDVICDAREECVDGACFCRDAYQDCAGPPSEACCPDGCVNLDTDTSNCGSCGHRCAPGDSCEEGRCRCGGSRGCTLGSQVCCSGSCRSVLTDENNCGPTTDTSGCGNACRPGVDCVDGRCSCGTGGDCGSGETCCFDDYCVNLDTSFNDCGDCDNVCRLGEDCIDGQCECGPGRNCSDGNSCTEDPCVHDRCEHHTNDIDNDGYCDEDCPDSASGLPGDCFDGDCNDGNPDVNPLVTEDCGTPYDDNCNGNTNDIGAAGCHTYYRDNDDDDYGQSSDFQCLCFPTGAYTSLINGDCDDSDDTINPGRPDICNGIDDDCDGLLDDGSADCPGHCCGTPVACRECCNEGSCPGEHPACTAYFCGCDPGYTSCDDTCDCNTGGSEVCCGTTCHSGECCLDEDCTDADVSNCNTSTHLCFCDGRVCTGTCYTGADCCTDADCTVPETCGGGGVSHRCGCTSTDCSTEGYECGSPSDGCSSTLSCGPCAEVFAPDCQGDFTCGCNTNGGGAACDSTECCCSDGCHGSADCPCP